jgi:hypothetical protein
LRGLAFDKSIRQWKVGVETDTADGVMRAAWEIVLFTNTLDYTTAALSITDISRVYSRATYEGIATIYSAGDGGLAGGWTTDNDVSIIDRLVANS